MYTRIEILDAVSKEVIELHEITWYGGANLGKIVQRCINKWRQEAGRLFMDSEFEVRVVIDWVLGE